MAITKTMTFSTGVATILLSELNIATLPTVCIVQNIYASGNLVENVSFTTQTTWNDRKLNIYGRKNNSEQLNGEYTLGLIFVFK